MLITPYVPNVVNATDPQAILERPSVPRSERKTTIYFRGKCTPQTDGYVGKKMRHAMVWNSYELLPYDTLLKMHATR